MQLIRRDQGRGYLDTCLWVPKESVNIDGMKAALSYTFFDNRNPTTLQLWRETRHHLVVPREFWKAEELGVEVLDCRPSHFPCVSIKSRITLDLKNPGATTQRDSVQAMLNARGGILQLACGLGKTVVALEVVARLGVPALIVIPDTQLIEQWRREILKHLDVSADDIGLIQADSFDWKKPIVLATYTTLAKRAAMFPEEVRRWFGVTIWDEAHHVAAPTFARSVDLFYGRRYGLTATPTRSDGLHVIYDFHIGPVLFKDLRQDLRPDIGFLWTGLEVDLSDAKTKQMVCDVNGEVHYSKLASYFGQWRPRLEFILNKVMDLNLQGRKILVLSNSVAEIVNLLALWNGATHLYTDIPLPTPQEVGETVLPTVLEKRELGRLKHRLGALIGELRDPTLNPIKRKNYETTKHTIEHRLQQHICAEKVGSELGRRQLKYIRELVAGNDSSRAGLMIHKVKPEVRTKMLEEKSITFAITKYGREGLDNPALDTLLVCEPITDRGGLEQMLGRIQRDKEGKRKPLALFVEDNIGLIIGMCSKLRTHLRSWPVEQGGAYDFDRIGHPQNRRKEPLWMSFRGFGHS